MRNYIINFMQPQSPNRFVWPQKPERHTLPITEILDPQPPETVSKRHFSFVQGHTVMLFATRGQNVILSLPSDRNFSGCILP